MGRVKRLTGMVVMPSASFMQGKATLSVNVCLHIVMRLLGAFGSSGGGSWKGVGLCGEGVKFEARRL